MSLCLGLKSESAVRCRLNEAEMALKGCHDRLIREALTVYIQALKEELDRVKKYSEEKSV